MTTPNGIKDQRAHWLHPVAPRYVTYSAIAVPLMVLSGWALLASVPIALMTWGAWTDPRGRPLRWWSIVIASLYAIPLAQYLTRPNAQASLSSMLHPAMAVAIAAASAVVALKILRTRRA